jgi:DNA-binding XRE family transcriptional regulator
MKEPPTINIEGRQYVLIPQDQYHRLIEASADPLPEFPSPDARGYRPALEFIDVSIARDIIRDRRAAGLTQQQLAHAAGIRQETLSRIESGKNSPTIRTLQKIERALKLCRSRNQRRSMARRVKHEE